MHLKTEELAPVAATYFGAPIRFFNPVTQEWGKYRKLTASDLGLVTRGTMKWNLLLTPLDKVTDGHAVELEQIIMAGFWQTSPQVQRYTIERRKRQLVNDQQEYMTYKAYQYLISKGYAVPLWFDIDHWANGKTAIELGLAMPTE